MALIDPTAPNYAAACKAASDVLGTAVRYLGEYAHGPTSIGMAIKRGNKLEIQMRTGFGPGASGGYLRANEFALQALIREHTEEEMPQGSVLTVDELYQCALFVGHHDSIGHTVVNQSGLREWGIFLLIDPDASPALANLSFTPTKEAEAKIQVDVNWMKAHEAQFRKHEYKLLLRAALAAEGSVNLPRLTRDPYADGYFLDMVDNRETVF